MNIRYTLIILYFAMSASAADLSDKEIAQESAAHASNLLSKNIEDELGRRLSSLSLALAPDSDEVLLVATSVKQDKPPKPLQMKYSQDDLLKAMKDQATSLIRQKFKSNAEVGRIALLYYRFCDAAGEPDKDVLMGLAYLQTYGFSQSLSELLKDKLDLKKIYSSRVKPSKVPVAMLSEMDLRIAKEEAKIAMGMLAVNPLDEQALTILRHSVHLNPGDATGLQCLLMAQRGMKIQAKPAKVTIDQLTKVLGNQGKLHLKKAGEDRLSAHLALLHFRLLQTLAKDNPTAILGIGKLKNMKITGELDDLLKVDMIALMPKAKPKPEKNEDSTKETMAGTSSNDASPGEKLIPASRANDDPDAKSTLSYLASQQTSSGQWPHDAHINGVSAACALAFLSAGHSTAGGEYKHVVEKYVDSNCKSQRPDGSVGFHCSASCFTIMAMCEALAMDLENERLRQFCEKGVEYALQTQLDNGGWSGSTRPAEKKADEINVSATVWWTMALFSARLAGLHVPEKAFEKVCKVMKDVGSRRFRGTIYMTTCGGKSAGYDPDHLIDLYCGMLLQFLGESPKNSLVSKLMKSAVKEIPDSMSMNFWSLHFLGLGAFQLGKESKEWKEFQETMVNEMNSRRVRTPQGSYWENRFAFPNPGGPQGKSSSKSKSKSGSREKVEATGTPNPWGRCGTTAMAILTLRIPHRYGDVHAAYKRTGTVGGIKE